MAEPCFNCESPVRERNGVVFVRWRRQELYCSESCLRATRRQRARARAAILRRWSLRLGAPALLVFGVAILWTHHRAPARRSISVAWPEIAEWQQQPPPVVFGPPWPPTDQQWTAVFDGARWTFPLPGPARRAATPDGNIFAPAPPREPPARCRDEGHCGVDLGGELWGEHVYAALDGVVERVQAEGNDAPGGRSVRILHFGGMAYTQYFHLAATPKRIVRGAHVRAGDVIGLLGDTGLDRGRAHLCFALSVRPSRELAEVYWDPAPWLAGAALRVPPHGTVAGYVPPLIAAGR
jgi:murein DD-endopeptidase MepM/ murein hydrolase activator NlpD